MAKQHFADIGVDFDMNDIKGRIGWEQFIEAVKDKDKDAKLMRVRFLGDRVRPGLYIFDLSYAYATIDGDVYDLMFPESHVEGSRSAVKKMLYKVLKDSGVFVPNAFSALSVFV